MKKMCDDFVMKHRMNKVNLFRHVQKTNKNLSISTTTTSNSQKRPNEKIIKKNSIASNYNNEKDTNNELNDTLLEEYLETEGKRLLHKLSESVQTTKNGHIIINSKTLLNQNDSKENGAFVFDRMLSHPNKTKITQKNRINNNVILTLHKKQMSVMFSPPIKKKPTMSSNTSNNITLRSNSNTTNTNSNNTKQTIKKKSSLLLNNLTNINNIRYNDKIAYLINNADNSIAPQIKKVVHMKTTSVTNNKTTSLNRLTPTNKKEKKRNISGSFNDSNMNKIKKPEEK